LSLVWLSCGCVGLYVGLADARWGMALLALATVVYGAAWLRVAALARLLTWPELVAPWRSTKSGR
jgi:hypothetical protein